MEHWKSILSPGLHDVTYNLNVHACFIQNQHIHTWYFMASCTNSKIIKTSIHVQSYVCLHVQHNNWQTDRQTHTCKSDLIRTSMHKMQRRTHTHLWATEDLVRFNKGHIYICVDASIAQFFLITFNMYALTPCIEHTLQPFVILHTHTIPMNSRLCTQTHTFGLWHVK